MFYRVQGPPNQGAGLQGGQKVSRTLYVCSYRSTKNDQIPHDDQSWEEACSFGADHASATQGRETSGPIFGTHPYGRTVCFRATKYCLVIKLNERIVFTASTTFPALRQCLKAGSKFLVTSILTRDLFAVTNLLVSLINC